MQRRNFVKAASVTAFGAGFPVSGAIAQNRYTKYAGQTVAMSVPVQPHYDAMLKILPDFSSGRRASRSTLTC